MDVLWDRYNSEESWLPFWIPMIVWSSSYMLCVFPRTSRPNNTSTNSNNSNSNSNTKETTDVVLFHKWYALHNFHNYGAIIMGWISMYYNDDQIFNERIPILWSLGYFVIDFIDCAARQDMTYLFHAFACLFLGIVNYTSPHSRLLRLNSRAAQCELSNPLMHLAKKTRNPIHFLAFAMVFTCCRILWIPLYIIMPYKNTGVVAWTDFRMLILIAFYGLNCFWYIKILRILLTGGKKEKKSEDTD